MRAAETATAVPAHAMLEQCGLLPNPPAGAITLDIACGAGVVTACLFGEIKNDRNDLTVICGDIDQTMIDLSIQRIQTNSWNAQARLLDAQALDYEDSHFTHVLMNFGPQLMSDPMLALRGIFPE